MIQNSIKFKLIDNDRKQISYFLGMGDVMGKAGRGITKGHRETVVMGMFIILMVVIVSLVDTCQN